MEQNAIVNLERWIWKSDEAWLWIKWRLSEDLNGEKRKAWFNWRVILSIKWRILRDESNGVVGLLRKQCWYTFADLSFDVGRLGKIERIQQKNERETDVKLYELRHVAMDLDLSFRVFVWETDYCKKSFQMAIIHQLLDKITVPIKSWLSTIMQFSFKKDIMLRKSKHINLVSGFVCCLSKLEPLMSLEGPTWLMVHTYVDNCSWVYVYYMALIFLSIHLHFRRNIEGHTLFLGFLVLIDDLSLMDVTIVLGSCMCMCVKFKHNKI